jgi:hypothetical protein
VKSGSGLLKRIYQENCLKKKKETRGIGMKKKNRLFNVIMVVLIAVIAVSAVMMWKRERMVWE